MTNYLDLTIALPMPCPHCGGHCAETIRQLLEHQGTICTSCGRPMSVREHWSVTIKEISKALEQNAPAASEN
jgi:hypothetical protein